MQQTNSIIAVDLMGGDDDPLGRLRAVKKFKASHAEINLTLFLNTAFLESHKAHFNQLPTGIDVVTSEQAISMAESPLIALRKKRLSSMSMSIKAVADKQADAVLTAGNSGALVAFAKYWLKSNATIERPALATVLPGKPKSTLLLDIGATLEYRADDLYALAELGVQMAQQFLPCQGQPEVALLNVGTEHIKGHDTVQQADRLLQDSELNYLGFCEGTHLFNGFADVVCCDGFVGNITLKACEGLLHQIYGKQQLPWWKKMFCQFNDANFNPAQYNGAILLGLEGLVIKAHGNSDEVGFYHALVKTAAYINNSQ
ncbi:MAG: phosphate acyltransferase [Marinicella sp.]